jgi:hypothetical protein
VKTDPPHQEGWHPHSQPNPRPKGTGKGHANYSVVGLSACLTFEGHFGENPVTSVLDFFNPLSIPHDILTLPDLWEEVTTGWDEVPTEESE